MVKSASLVVVVLVVVVMVMERGVEGKVNYNCILGDMLSVHDGNVMHQFCALDGMEPPFMNRGGYVIAQSPSAMCYECICEENIGKACCEIGCPAV